MTEDAKRAQSTFANPVKCFTSTKLIAFKILPLRCVLWATLNEQNQKINFRAKIFKKRSKCETPERFVR
jgi:hypothetical protein